MNDFPVNSNNILIGGLKKFKFIPTADILSEPEIFQNKLIGDYTFKPGKNLLTGYFDKDSGQLIIDDAISNKGDLVKSTVNAILTDNSKELDLLFCEMSCEKFIMFIIDNYKNVRVLGRVNCGATFSFSFSTNDKIADVPQYKFKIYYESRCVPPISSQITDIC